MTAPAVVELAGGPGDGRTLELRRDGEVLASRQLTLGPDLEPRWAPALAPTPEIFTISSDPAGARVALDGDTLDGVTPLQVSLVADRDYQLEGSLDGHDPAGWGFDLGKLSAAQRESRNLHFALAASVPPADLVVVASYPVTVQVAGRQQTGEGEVRVPVPPGSYTVQLSAPRVFFDDSLDVVLESGQERRVELPRTVTIPVSAQGRCRLIIDGREVGDLPQRVELTIGPHMFRFEWEGGLSKEVPHTIGLSTERIFEVKPS